MSTALPRPSRPSNAPPNAALPALPVAKTRKSTGNLSLATPSKSAASTPRSSGLRAPSNAYTTAPTSPGPASALPQSRLAPATPGAKTLRKSVSINSFPQPPGRTSSLPPSPLAAEPTRKSSSLRRSKATTQSTFNLGGSTPSLLNGSGEGKSVAAGAGLRMSDGLISVSSPPQSRSSSAQDSYSTSATTYDDPTEPNGETRPASTGDAGLDKGKFDGKGNVVVSVRVRPDPTGNDNPRDWSVEPKRSLISHHGKDGGDYYYDNVFGTSDNNSRVYDSIAKRLVRRVMEGYHGTVFAYGMTGTGKTFSMQGTASSPGVIPLAITDIFSYIRETPSREFLLRVSYLEIYNEKIHDLLSMPANGGAGGAPQDEIKLREDSKRGVYAFPLKEEIVQSPTQLLRVIARGDQARRTASTQFNARSSRSHAVVQIVVESRERSPGNAGASKRGALLPGGVRVSTLSLIDLAGSEKAAETKERRTEGSHINKSLLTLGNVIAKLSDNKSKDGKLADKEGKHLPYRDSKLTRLLQGALSGGSLVSILCTIQTGSAGTAAAANTHATETLNTLKFAARAKNNIVSHAKRAEEALGAGGEGGARVLLERYRLEIQELRAQLEKKGKDKDSLPTELTDEEKARIHNEVRAKDLEASQRHEEQLLEMQLARTALKERIDHLNRLILSSKSSGVNRSGSYSSLGINSRFSQMSTRSSLAASNSGRTLDRTSSMTSASSTIGRRSSGGKRRSGEPSVMEDGQSTPEPGDGHASLAAQNEALQSDLADKNRYIATLEKRLLQARRASSSRTSVGLGSGKGILVGEDHSVAALLKDKDAEIAELRARIDDKDRMLAALRSVARSRDTADSSYEARASLSPPPSATPRSPQSPPQAQYVAAKPRTRGSDELKILDEMIMDRIESGHLVRSSRGSVRIANEGPKGAVPTEPVPALDPQVVAAAAGSRAAEARVSEPKAVAECKPEPVEA